jgi:hypothetical protein
MDSVFHLAQAKDPAARKHGFAWIALCLALAVHVIDETLTDFLSVYNPAGPSHSHQASHLAVADFFI